MNRIALVTGTGVNTCSKLVSTYYILAYIVCLSVDPNHILIGQQTCAELVSTRVQSGQHILHFGIHLAFLSCKQQFYSSAHMCRVYM